MARQLGATLTAGLLDAGSHDCAADSACRLREAVLRDERGMVLVGAGTTIRSFF